MRLGLEVEESVPESVVSAPAFLVELEPRPTAFFRNLRDLFWTPRQPALHLVSYPAAPWPDVFVRRALPWGGLSTSALVHVAVIAALLSVVRLFPERPAIVDHPVLSHKDVIYYTPAEYLAQLDTGSAPSEKAEKGDPEFSPQPIISVPPQADNHVQTIVTPPDVKLDRDVPMPNIVAWSQRQPSVPLGATARNAADLKAPTLASAAVVAPSPEVKRSLDRPSQSLSTDVVAPAPEVSLAAGRKVLQAPQPPVVAPAPQVNAENIRKLGDLNIGHSEVVAPAPQLPVAERSVAARVGPLVAGTNAVPPPPSAEASGPRSGGGRVIALNVRPLAPNIATEVPEGNRRGSFAATPEGNPDARGTPPADAKNAKGNEAGAGSGKGSGAAADRPSDAPPGLYVGSAPKAATTAAAAGNSPFDHARMIASITPPRVTSAPAHPANEVDSPSPLDRQVFGDRRFYRMNLNMPNLNSSGGSWVVRFAELKDDGQKGDLTSPVATRTADPAYPLELMRHNVQGTVTLYAVIHGDGSVSDVKVLQSVDDRLDDFATAALTRWKFRPATKNGNPVALEAVVVIPFHPSRSSF
jgi:TonB family protein